MINTRTVSIDYLGGLPDNTFGKAYWRFLNDHVSNAQEEENHFINTVVVIQTSISVTSHHVEANLCNIHPKMHKTLSFAIVI